MSDGTEIDLGYFLDELNRHLATGKPMSLAKLQGLRELIEDMFHRAPDLPKSRGDKETQDATPRR